MLDTLLVHKKDWQEVHCWECKMLISGVWGPPMSSATVVADMERAVRAFCWVCPPDEQWQVCHEQLCYFPLVLTRRPGCPEQVIQSAKQNLNASDFAKVQRQVVLFYIRTFVTHFARLPIPPIASF